MRTKFKWWHVGVVWALVAIVGCSMEFSSEKTSEPGNSGKMLRQMDPEYGVACYRPNDRGVVPYSCVKVAEGTAQ